MSLIINHIAYVGNNGVSFACVKNADLDSLVIEAKKIIEENPKSTARLLAHLNSLHVASNSDANPECFDLKNPSEIEWLSRIIALSLSV